MTNVGQDRAQRELQVIAAASGGALTVLDDVPDIPDGYVGVRVRASMRGVRRYGGGLPVGLFEDLELWVPPSYPLDPPTLFATHFRFAGYPHVAGRYLCLYVDPSNQWSPSDGMFGFVERIDQWFSDAAAGRLDPDNGPRHPPVPLGFGYSPTQLLIRPDIPTGDRKRVLWANLEPRGPDRLDVTRFHRHAPDATPRLALAVLANTAVDEDYASTFGGLLRQLEHLGFHARFLVKDLIDIAARNPKGEPVAVIVGTLNRGSRTDAQHHLVAWELPAELAEALRSLRRDPTDAEIAQLDDWANHEQLQWMRVHEARPAVTRRRDRTTPMATFFGKCVEVWGAGALGGWIAEFITRASPRSITVRDRGRVGAGLVVRQPYDETDITSFKAKALAERLRAIDPSVDVQWCTDDLVPSDGQPRNLGDADVIIDATASRAVGVVLERAVLHTEEPPAVVSVVTDRTAQLGAMFATNAVAKVGPEYLAREALKTLGQRGDCQHFVDAFWNVDDIDDLVHPEPGCSAPTFHGSASDAAAVAAHLVNSAARFLADGHATEVELAVVRATASSERARRQLTLHPGTPTVLSADGGYHVVLTPAAISTISQSVAVSFAHDPVPETGGALFGCRNDATQTLTVDLATLPPADSEGSQHGFQRGVAGLADMARAVEITTGGATSWLGDWHTHPHGIAAMSNVDFATATEIEQHGASLVLIWAGTPDSPSWHAHILDPLGHTAMDGAAPTAVPAASPKPRLKGVRVQAAARHARSPMPNRRALDPIAPNRRPLALALSGGGFRATLAAVGVIRFLADAHLYDHVRLISSVSGGSIAGALAATTWTRGHDPESVDRHLVAPTLSAITDSSLLADLLRNSWRALPPGRSRTTVLADRLDRRFFDGALLEDLPSGCWFMINATNAAEGVRFRFDGDVIGDYVNGSIPVEGTGVRLATAVAASAAVPGYFPPLLLDVDLPHSGGSPVPLVDGGVYDNLGLEAVLRERQELKEAFLISLNAGALLDRPRPSLMSKIPVARGLWRANSIMYRQTGALRTRRLHDEIRSPSNRDGLTFNLATTFDDEQLDDGQRQRLALWRATNAEHTDFDRDLLRSLPTSFSRLDIDTATALVQRTWWLCGATMITYHPELLSGLPRWRELPTP